MKQIGLISDTHGFLHPKVFEYFKDCDEIWHAGDIGTLSVLDQLEAFKPTRAVFGNIDGQEIRSRTKEVLEFELEGTKVLMLHIGGYPPKYNKSSKVWIEKIKPKLFICGHSHILKVISDPKKNNLIHLNPGAAGHVGFHKVKTLLRFQLNKGAIEKMEVIELDIKKPR